MPRTEVIDVRSGAHLGHVFNGGSLSAVAVLCDVAQHAAGLVGNLAGDSIVCLLRRGLGCVHDGGKLQQHETFSFLMM